MGLIKLPSDRLIVTVCQSTRNQRIHHAVRLTHPDQEVRRQEVTVLCGWRGVPSYIVPSKKGWGVGTAGMYSDQRWCRKCRPLAKELKAEIDGPAFEEFALRRSQKGSSSPPKPAKPGNAITDVWPEADAAWVRSLEFPTLAASDVSRTAQINVEWRCSVRGHRNYVDQPVHIQTLVSKKKDPCPFCRAGLSPESWTRARVLELVESIGPHIASLSAADRYILLLQTGIMDSSGSWADAVVNAITGSSDSQELRGKLASLSEEHANNYALLQNCVGGMRRILWSVQWTETERPEMMKVWSRRSIKGFHSALDFWASSRTADVRLASVRKADLTDEEISGLWRGAPISEAGDELRRCLRDKATARVPLDQLPITGVRTPESTLQSTLQPPTIVDLDEDAELEQELPVDSVEEILTASERLLIADQDLEAIDYFIASQLSKLWSVAFENMGEARAQAATWSGTGFGQLVRDRFVFEIEAIENLSVPDDWRFVPEGSRSLEPVPPRIMQLLTAVRLLQARTVGVGNWSLMGGGKTLSAILSSAALGSRLTLIVCPNTTVEGWCAEIGRTFPLAAIERGWRPPGTARRRFIVLNVEQFQLADSPERIKGLLGQEIPDFIVLDEVHKFKQRDSALTRRRQCLLYLLGHSAETNPGLRVLAMTGTPVINNLIEARSLIELCTLSYHQDLDTKPTVMNAMKVHARLARLGLRYRPDYMKEFAGVERCPIDVSELRADLAAAANRYEAELLLIRAKLPLMAGHSSSRTVIYCELVDKVHDEIAVALRAEGRRVGFFRGDDKSGLELFKRGKIDCLVASSAIGTGIDGLQHCTDRLIIATLPWNASDYDQLLGRFFRPKSDGGAGNVRVILPWATIPDASRPGGEWSLDKARWNRSRYKATLADTAVDGVLPRGELRSPEQAFADLQQWLRRLNEGPFDGVSPRRVVAVGLPETNTVTRARPENALAAFHARIARRASSLTHAALVEDDSEWRWYHAEIERVEATWPFRPVDRCIDWIRRRIARRGASLAIADLGCGLAPLRSALGGECNVRSFDHVAVDQGVIVANIAERVPLDDNSVDIAVLCLSADWQQDAGDCFREAARILAVDGQLLLWETPAFVERLGGLQAIAVLLGRLGLTVVQTFEERFIGIVAAKL